MLSSEIKEKYKLLVSLEKENEKLEEQILSLLDNLNETAHKENESRQSTATANNQLEQLDALRQTLESVFNIPQYTSFQSIAIPTVQRIISEIQLSAGISKVMNESEILLNRISCGEIAVQIRRIRKMKTQNISQQSAIAEKLLREMKK